MKTKAKEQITVELTYSWTFNERDWKFSKKQWEEVIANPRIVFGYDHISSWHNLNDICYPELAECDIKKSN
jgi:hypothetical protein